MRRWSKQYKTGATLLVLILAVLLFLGVFDQPIMIVLNMIGMSILIFTLAYDAVVMQRYPQAKRLCVIGLCLILLTFIYLLVLL